MALNWKDPLGKNKGKDEPAVVVPPAPKLLGNQGQILTTLVFEGVEDPFDYDALWRGKGKWRLPQGQKWASLFDAIRDNPIIKIAAVKKGNDELDENVAHTASSVVIHVSESQYNRFTATGPQHVLRGQARLDDIHCGKKQKHFERDKPKFAFIPTKGLAEGRIIVKFGVSIYLPDDGEAPFGDLLIGGADGELVEAAPLRMMKRQNAEEYLGRMIEFPGGLYASQQVVLLSHCMEHSSIPVGDILPSAFDGGIAISVANWKKLMEGEAVAPDTIFFGLDAATDTVRRENGLVIATIKIKDEDGPVEGNEFRIALRHPSVHQPQPAQAGAQQAKADNKAGQAGGQAKSGEQAAHQTPPRRPEVVAADADQRRHNHTTTVFDIRPQRNGAIAEVNVQVEVHDGPHFSNLGVGLWRLSPGGSHRSWTIAFDEEGRPARTLDPARTLRLMSTAGSDQVTWQAPGMAHEQPVGALPAKLSWGGNTPVRILAAPSALRERFFGYVPVAAGSDMTVSGDWNWIGRAKFGAFRELDNMALTDGKSISIDNLQMSRFHAAFRQAAGGGITLRQLSTTVPLIIVRKDGTVENLAPETWGQADRDAVADHYEKTGEYEIREGREKILQPGDLFVIGAYLFRLEE
ncbi:hypothetical protein [Magnetospirillum sp. 15-1]|uniref:hypothetical protein n=1 Tax=Magnetospirillum sp. 15-1 TaxID=1979370 RepID=UPI001144EA27|nr:hypothetical protein [Magnetospirillum sp. 15-1]